MKKHSLVFSAGPCPLTCSLIPPLQREREREREKGMRERERNIKEMERDIYRESARKIERGRETEKGKGRELLN